MGDAFARFGPMKPGPNGPPNPSQQGVGYVDNTTPIGDIDGHNVTYTLVDQFNNPLAPNPAESLLLLADGNACVLGGPTTDGSGNPMFTYTVDGYTVTFNNPLPSTIVTLRAFFRYKISSSA